MKSLKIDEAVNIRSGENLDKEVLAQYLKDNLVNFSNIEDIQQFPGGYSNLTYLIKTNNQDFVLRRAPFGANIKGAHDMAREYKILRLVGQYYKAIPKTLFLCENEAILGSSFYLMEKVNGVILRGKSAKEYSIDENKMHHISEKLIDNLVALHQINIENTELANLGKPEGYVERQVTGWIGRYEKSKTDDLPQMDTLATWLINYKPKAQQPTLIHNDYKYDNVVFDSNISEIIAVLDWEMATIGDPLMDLGATLAYWCEPNEGAFLQSMNITWLPGNLTRKQVVARYSQKTGTDTSDILFYYVFGLYKNAVIMQQIYARWKKGITSDPRFEQLIYGVNEIAKLATKAINENKI